MNSHLKKLNKLNCDLQENLHEMEEKYRKAMVTNAQLDNEKQALLYQVDCLKDRSVPLFSALSFFGPFTFN